MYVEPYNVESNLPLIPKGNSKYPWLKMNVGDSFFVPARKTKALQLGSRISSAINSAHKKYPELKFESRKIYENCVFIGARVWRVQ